MAKLTKNKPLYLFLTTLILFGFTANVMAGTYDNGRIIPSGKVTIYSENNQVGEYTEEAPLPMQSILNCTSGDCALRMPNLSARVKENTPFAINETQDSRSIFIKEGSFFFAIPQLDKPLVIATAAGVVTVQQMFLNASNNGENVLSGYITVSNKGTELGVLEGGSLVVSTENGEQTIEAGNRILLAQSAPAKSSNTNAAQLGETSDDSSGAAGFGLLGIPAGIIATVLGLSVAGDDDKNEQTVSKPLP